MPPALRDAFRSLGPARPTLWPQDTFSRAQRKALRRCLIDKVVLDRRAPDMLDARIIWRGGAVSALAVPCTVGRLIALSAFRQLEAQLLRLESQGKADEEIAQILTAQGFRSSQHSALLARTGQLIRLRHGRLPRYWGPRPRRVAGALTIPQIANAVGVKPHGIYHLISCGRIKVQRDAETGRYLFPDQPETLEALRQFRDGQLPELRY